MLIVNEDAFGRWSGSGTRSGDSSYWFPSDLVRGSFDLAQFVISFSGAAGLFTDHPRSELQSIDGSNA